MTDVFIGFGLVGAVALIWYLIKHHTPTPTVAPAAIANTLSAGIADSWETLKADLPAMVSAEVQRLTADLEAALKRAQMAEAQLVADAAAHKAALAAVANRVSAAVTGSPELRP